MLGTFFHDFLNTQYHYEIIHVYRKMRIYKISCGFTDNLMNFLQWNVLIVVQIGSWHCEDESFPEWVEENKFTVGT
ncbi:hypothetical protein ACH50_13780 [Franconibacter pulveris]|uniref:Uncharacterized protein n=1 Tax=Franconibacter pulveris TaxID=435910 RepID=A0A0J8VNL0_9ENTR|nr:hypothetical protein ACH50_13780 [Franconibacter pulveris]